MTERSARADQPLPVGVIGVGYLGQHHARLYSRMAGVRLVGVYDTVAERAVTVAREAHCAVFPDLDRLLKEVKAVSVVVPTSSHYDIALRCLEAGLDVLLEKPMTTTLEQADALIAAADRQGAVLQIGHLERFNGAVLAVEPFLTTPRFIESHRLGPFIERGTDVDVVLDLMIHDIDMVLSLVRSPVEEIRAVGVPVLSSQVDIANARIEFANGCAANVTASRVSKDKMRKIRVFQPDAYISIDYQKQDAVVYRRVLEDGQPKILFEPLRIEKEEPLKVELGSFVRSVTQRSAPVVSGRDGREALRVALEVVTAMERSMKRLTGQVAHGTR
ncbi:MAG TPA: Gfo/Idh/MocA family oxidoreductase [Nitrospiria bacterium]|nr:Gfo/Idh/MocA family oxidoreductase [Nitrospiria bacterium]